MRTLQDYDYNLPESLIAQFPPKTRGDSRLLVLQNTNTNPAMPPSLQDLHFNNFIDFLNPGDLLVVNNTRVLPARIFAQKQTGGLCEILVERILTKTSILAHVRASKSPKPQQVIIVNNEPTFIMKARQGALFILESIDHKDILTILESIGHMPLPPYITRTDQIEDTERYQTVFNKEKGAVAAPTAGLHFTDMMLTTLTKKGIQLCEITLHVGAGTFQPVRCDNLDNHTMHSEWVNVPQETVDLIQSTKNKNGRIIAVGTTVVRALESAALNANLSAFQGDTNIFIREGFTFKVVDGLLTNFHLPKSTLLVLVSAFIGYEEIKRAYEHAIAQHYRFFSYGDAMLLLR